MLFNTPGAYLNPAQEYYEKHGFDYSHGRSTDNGLFSLNSSYTGLEMAVPVEPCIVPNSGLERITTSYATGDDFVSGLIADKTRFSREAVMGLARQIQERQSIKSHNLNRIDYDSCRCGSYLHELLVWGDSQLTAKRRQTLDMVMFSLNKERRMEEVSCWRDVSLLKKDLVRATAEYASAARREALFETREGGA